MPLYELIGTVRHHWCTLSRVR